MPIKELHSAQGPKGAYSFGGGSEVIYADHTEDPATGGPYYYTIFTNGGDDTVYGSETEDYISGGDGSDHLYGGMGGDTLDAGSWGSTDSGKGQNTAVNYLFGDGPSVAPGADEPVSWSISGNVSGGSDTLYGGNGASNLLYGDGAGLRLSGGATFTGGADVIYAGYDGTNEIWGDGTVNSGDKTTTLVGGADTIRFGIGSDAVYGDFQILEGVEASVTAGADTFIFQAVGGTDNLYDFQAGIDTLDFRLIGIATATLAGNDLFITGDDAFAEQVGDDLLINLGAATGGAESFLLVHGVDSISVDDVLFTDTQLIA